MIRRQCLPGYFASILFAALALSAIRAEDAPQPADVDKLIELLEKGDFDQRKDAAKKLEALGERARTALEKAAKESDSPEIRDTVERLLGSLQRTRLVVEAIDNKGKPVAGAEGSLTVTLQSQLGGEEEVKPIEIKTDAQGRYVQSVASTGAAYVNLDWKQWHPVFPENISFTYVSLQPGETRVRFILQKGGTVTGKVMAADGDAPLEASIQLISDAGQDEKNIDLDDADELVNDQNTPLNGNSDAKGEFTIEHVPPGRYFVFARHPEHVTAFCGAVNVEESGSAQVAAAKLTAKAKVLGGIKVKLLDSKGEAIKDSTFNGSVQQLPEGAQTAEQRAQARKKIWRSLEKAVEREAQVTTNEEGIAEIKDLQPGKYSLTLHHEDNEELHHIASIIVEAGKTTSLSDAKPMKGGIASGTINTGGHGGNNFSIYPLNWGSAEDLFLLSDVPSLENWFTMGAAPLSACDEKGHFELRKMIPGRYSLCILLNQSLVGIVNGVDIVAEKTTVVPDVKFSTAESAPFNAHGIVVLPDGKPADGATISVVHKSGNSTTFNTNPDGTFQLNEIIEKGSAAQVYIGLPGYKHCHLNLATPGIDLANLRVVLEKQLYGSVSVIVRDAQGRPLKGARVQVKRSGNQVDQNHVSDKAGKVSLKNLIAGKRELSAALDGYFLEKPLEVAIQPNVEANAEIVMKPGYHVAGSVEIPPGFDPAKVLVSLHRAGTDEQLGTYDAIHVASVDAKGHFEFHGVGLGKFRLYGQYPGLITKHSTADFDYEITDKPVELKCVLMASASAQFELSPQWRGSDYVISEPGKWKAENPHTVTTPRVQPGGGMWMLKQRIMALGGGTNVNSLGQCSTPSYLPGRYDLLISPATEEFDESASCHVRATVVFPGVEIAPSAKPQVVRLPAIDSSASISGNVVLNSDSPWQADELGIGNLSLTIESDRATSEVSFSIPESVDPAHTLQISGTPPPEFHLQHPGEFSVTGLVPGEYKIYCNFEHYEGEGWSWNLKHTEIGGAPKGAKPIKTFTVTKGQALALGEIKIDLPAAVRKLMREQHAKQIASQAEMNLNNANDDGEGDFRP